MPAKPDATPALPGLSPAFSNSSDGGILALREIGQRLGIADRLAARVTDPRDPQRIRHSIADITRFRMMMIAAGYEDGDDAAGLRHASAFKLALGHPQQGAALCSQPTISRLEKLPQPRDLPRMGRAMVAQYCASFRQVPRRITLDIDGSFDAVHGDQQLRLFNAYYDEYGFQPIVVFDGEGRPVAAMLRPARRSTGREVRGFLRRCKEFIDCAASWSRVERIIARVEASAPGTDTRFVVTNITGASARRLYEALYCRRGQAENHIKSWKTHLAADRTPCCRAAAKQLRLMLHTGAYWLL